MNHNKEINNIKKEHELKLIDKINELIGKEHLDDLKSELDKKPLTAYLKYSTKYKKELSLYDNLGYITIRNHVDNILTDSQKEELDSIERDSIKEEDKSVLNILSETSSLDKAKENMMSFISYYDNYNMSRKQTLSTIKTVFNRLLSCTANITLEEHEELHSALTFEEQRRYSELVNALINNSCENKYYGAA